MLVLSNNEETLKNALQQRGEDDRLTEDDVEAAFEDLPEDAPVKAYANVKALLAAAPERGEGAEGRVGRPHRDVRAERRRDR